MADLPAPPISKREAGKSHDKVLARARERFKYSDERDGENRKRQAEDTKFVFIPGNQWPDETRKARESAKDPCMEFPQLRQFINQVVNDQRQNRPGVRVHPASGDASEDVADILQGVIRGIEYDSRAESIYDAAYQNAVVGGRGYWRIVSEWESPQSFVQKLVLKRVVDPNTIRLDPDFTEPDGSDRKWGFALMPLTLDEFKESYPKAEPLAFIDDAKLWRPDDKRIIVADYYEREAFDRVVVKLTDGSVIWKDQLPEALPTDVGIAAERTATDHRVTWYTIAGGEQVLDEVSWPGTLIPIVCVFGEEVVVDGECNYFGLIAPAKDAQRLFNFGMTQQSIHLNNSPRSPYVAAVGQMEGLEGIWKNSNTSNEAVLPYHPVAIDGHPVPPPQRQMGSSPDSGWINWTQQQTMLMKSTIGMYESSLAMRSTETSGRAIRAREMQADNATFHFADNLGRAIAMTGRILVECIPTYYDTERIVSYVGTDDARKLVTINRADPLRAIRENDVTVGRYAVTVEAGPTFATRRQESAALLNELVQAFPALMQVAGDLVMKAQEFPDAEEFAERMRAILPPQIQQQIASKDRGGGEQQSIPPEVLGQLQQMQQAMQQMQQQAQALMAENADLKAGNQTKLQTQQMAEDGRVLSSAMDNAVKLVLELARPQDTVPVDPVAPGMTLEQAMALVVPLTQQVIAMGAQMAEAVKQSSGQKQEILQDDRMGVPIGIAPLMNGNP